MRKSTPIPLLVFILGLFSLTHSQAQSPGPADEKKGAFFIIPFYEYTQFKGLKLVSHSNNYTLWQGESEYDFTDEEIKEYNDNFSTEYFNSMTAVKIGYQLKNGLGLSVYAGVNHMHFKSWITPENEQSHYTNYPALTLGLAIDYQKAFRDNFIAGTYLSYNYSSAGSVAVDNNSGEDITSSSLKSMFWEADLYLAYRLKKLLPFIGAGFTQQFVHAVTEEKIPAINDEGQEVYNYTEFDSRYRGNAFYGFAGIEYSFNEKFSVNARCSFVNPLRANLGFRVAL